MFERKTAITIREIRGTIRKPSSWSLKSHYNGRRVSRKEQRTAVTAVAVAIAVAIAVAVAVAVATVGAATTTLCALINRLRYQKTYFRR
ncbi:hypothetical protein HZH68_008322 [Vespula germanica]|uniref:Uncharacterized protein n=1 Tax=Vespula germanica TaxID=30212 RepID=A0A834K4J0_VESGE|nr:hypothetical protein HZH68_008322 [Vespula germanica]